MKEYVRIFGIVLLMVVIGELLTGIDAEVLAEKEKDSKVLVKGKVVKYGTKEPLEGAEVRYKEMDGNVFKFGNRTKWDGRYEFKIPCGYYYELKAEKKPFYGYDVNTLDLLEEPAVQVVEVDFELSYIKTAHSYRVGAVVSLNGRLELIGKSQKNALRVVESNVNREGGIRGRKFELIIYDDHSNPDIAASLAKKLISKEGVLAIVGPSVTSTSRRVAEVTEKLRTPLISLGSGRSIVIGESDKDREWVFKVVPSNNLAMERILKYLASQRKKRIGILTVYGRDLEDLKKLAGKYGISIVAEEEYKPRAPDIISELTRIGKENPEAIINWSYGTSQLIAASNWKISGMTRIPLFQNQWFGYPDNINKLGGVADGIYGPVPITMMAKFLAPYDPMKDIALEYIDLYYETFKEPITRHIHKPHAWDAIKLVVDAIKDVGPNKKRIRENIENKKGFVGKYGVFNFSPTDHTGLTDEAFRIAVVKSGKLVPAK